MQFELFIILCIFIFGCQSAIESIVIRGSFTIGIREELNFFIYPLQDKKLFNEAKCANGDCQITTTTFPNKTHTHLQDIHFQVTIYKIELEFCCSIVPCKTPKYYAIQMPRDAVSSASCQQNNHHAFFPQFADDDGLTIGLFTWFMEGHNYRDLFENDSTSLYVPSSGTLLPVYSIIHYTGTVTQCQFYINGNSVKHLLTSNNVERISYYSTNVQVKNETSFLLTFNCTARFTWIIDGQYVQVKKSKAMNITVKQNPSVILSKKVTFAVEDRISQHKLEILSSNKIASISIVSLATQTDTPVITLTSLPQSSIVSRYWVVFHGLKLSMTGSYNVTVLTDTLARTWNTFYLTISQMPKLEVSPAMLNVGLGQRSVFDCVAYGQDIRGIRWGRKGLPMEADVVVEEFTANVQHTFGLRVTFVAPLFNDAGDYTCTVWTSHPRHVATAYAQLFVFYPGSPYIDPRYQLQNNTFNINEYNSTTFNLPDDWNNDEDDEGTTVDPFILGIIIAASLSGLLIMIVCTCLGCCLVNRFKLIKMQSSDKQQSSEDEEDTD